MTRNPRRAAVVALTCVTLVPAVAACGDDANDHTLLGQQLTDRLTAEDPPVASPVPASAAPGEPAVAVPTVAMVERTGVVVPVVALDNSFRPATVEANVGDEVVWENRGRNEHDVLSIEGTLDDGTAWGLTVEEFQPGAIYAHVFTEPGEYRYYCTIHGTTEVGMVGTVLVSA